MVLEAVPVWVGQVVLVWIQVFLPVWVAVQAGIVPKTIALVADHPLCPVCPAITAKAWPAATNWRGTRPKP